MTSVIDWLGRRFHGSTSGQRVIDQAMLNSNRLMDEAKVLIERLGMKEPDIGRVPFERAFLLLIPLIARLVDRIETLERRSGR